MGAFDALNIAGSSLGMHQTWLDTLSYNIANANTVRSTSEDAFQAQMVIAQAEPGGGVELTSTPTQTPVGPNGNNVDLRKETMAAMQTVFQYQTVTRAVSDRLALVRTAAGG